MSKSEFSKAALDHWNKPGSFWEYRRRRVTSDMPGWSRDEWQSWLKNGLEILFLPDINRAEAFAPLMVRPFAWDMGRDRNYICAEMRRLFQDWDKQLGYKSKIFRDNFEEASIAVSADPSCMNSADKACFLLDIVRDTIPETSPLVIENILKANSDRQFRMSIGLRSCIERNIPSKSADNLPELTSKFITKVQSPKPKVGQEFNPQ